MQVLVRHIVYRNVRCLLAITLFCMKSSVSHYSTPSTMQKPLVFGHRGMGCSIPGTLSKYPENSLSAFKAARDIGVDGIELDVFLSKRDEILVLHGFKNVNSLCLTTLPRTSDSDRQPFAMEDLVEEKDIKASDLLLRKPWVLLHDTNDMNQILEKHNGDVAASYTEYINSLEDANGEVVPTLEQVIEEVGDRVQYNIELKGKCPELGLRVLEVLERHPNIKVLISSFNWIPPTLEDDASDADNELEKMPNGPIEVDLLRPLVGNSLGIPIGLLFNNIDSNLPSIERIVECARSFNATFVNVAHNFWTMPQPFVGHSVEGMEALEYFVKEMHRYNLKVLSYFFESVPDSEADIKKHILAKVDVLCPNDVETALRLVRMP